MVEFEIDGRQFKFDKLPAIQQFHVSRKISPLIPPLLPVFAQFKKEQAALDQAETGQREDAGDGAPPEESNLALDKIGPLLQPFADGLAEMTDESSEYVFNACLSVVRYKHGDNWIPLWSASGKVVMVAELNDPSLLLRLVVRVIQDSLAPFIAGFLSGQKGATKGPNLR